MDDARAVRVNDQLVDPDTQRSDEPPKPEPEPHRSVIFVTTSVFMGYAALVVMQHQLKKVHDAIPGERHDDMIFKHASTLNYVGNLIFRIAHNFVFCFLSPRNRVHLSLGSMALAMATPALMICVLQSTWIGWVMLTYFLGGVAIGTFESNLLSCITPLGHPTKKWAIYGMPLGFNLVSVGGFLIIWAGAPLKLVYLIVCTSCLCSMALFHSRIPRSLPPPPSAAALPGTPQAPEGALAESVLTDKLPSDEEDESHFLRFRRDIRTWRTWLPKMAPHTIALMVDMYCVSFFSSVMLYILNDAKPGGMVPLFGPNTDTWLVPHDAYFSVYNLFTFFGDTLSRQLVYRSPRLINPLWYLLLSAIGAATCLSKIPLIAPLGIFLIFFGNGAVYGTSTKHIDTHLPRRSNLTALSIWLFIGDIGSVIGSNTYPYILPLICQGVVAPHMCVNVTGHGG